MKHFMNNIGVALRCLVMAFFHAAHAFIPCKYTEHERWGFNFKGERK
jgi:hypothetical protein